MGAGDGNPLKWSNFPEKRSNFSTKVEAAKQVLCEKINTTDKCKELCQTIITNMHNLVALLADIGPPMKEGIMKVTLAVFKQTKLNNSYLPFRDPYCD